ncbi:MAG: hypothetical protein ABSF28_27425 [Terracidiphilus sp.]|jgi:hypothetical protein
MATFTAIAFNTFETVGLVQARIEVAVREPAEYAAEHKPLRMEWVREVDSTGRKVIRIQWATDKQREGMTASATRSN